MPALGHMASYRIDRDGGCDDTQRDRNADRLTHGELGGDPGHDDDIHARGEKVAQLLPTSAEDKGVAALEPDHNSTRTRELDHPGGDGFLLRTFGATTLAHRFDGRLWTAQLERRRRDE